MKNIVPLLALLAVMAYVYIYTRLHKEPPPDFSYTVSDNVVGPVAPSARKSTAMSRNLNLRGLKAFPKVERSR